MMLFKLSLKNIRKSFRDYMVYFLTLILGVAIFYMFNSLDEQNAMMIVSSSTKEIIEVMLTMLSGVSVCVALILGFLIVYANNFLIKRRKKEFAVYMTLGMGKRQVSRILLGETVLIGLLSLAVGLAAGIFASQFMSILVAKMFEADMTAYTFIFSKGAMGKTILYFGIMFVIVMLFNTIAISKYKLIDLFQAAKKGEKGKMKSSFLSVLVFLAAVGILAFAYYQVTCKDMALDGGESLFIIALGCIGTYMVFWSMSGFLLNLLKSFRGFYFRGLNSFILRQVNNNINTAVFSMTVICLLFFVTICVFSAGLSMNNSLRAELRTLAPVDVNFSKVMDLSAPGEEAEDAQYLVWEDSLLTIEAALGKCGIDMSLFAPGYVEVSAYVNVDPGLTWETTLGPVRDTVTENYPWVRWETMETIMGVSEYNRLAAFYGQPQYELEEGEYIVLCTLEVLRECRDLALQENPLLRIGDWELMPKYDTCQDGYLYMNISNANTGVILVSDSLLAREEGKSLKRSENVFAGNYAGDTKAQKYETEEIILNADTQNLHVDLDGVTRMFLYDGATGMASVVTFIAIYLGIIFFIAGAALLALKELSESTDNRERYLILNKLGVDRKMQNRALLSQMGIFFGMPMLVAVIHSIFGIQYVSHLLAVYVEKDLFGAIALTGLILIVIYGGYFTATYLGSKRIIEE